MSTAQSAAPGVVVAKPPEVRSLPLLATLAAAGAISGLLIVVVYQWTLPAIEKNRAARLDAAIHTVLKGIDRYQTLYVQDGKLTTTLPAVSSGGVAERVYEGFDASGVRVGFAVAASPPGFADTIEILFGLDPSKHAMLGLAILSSKETPGLGDKIERETWREQFGRVIAPLTGVKKGAVAKPNDVEMITGATISSRAVINGLNKAIDRWTPILEAYLAGGGS